MGTRFLAALFILASGCFAQNWELGGVAGYGIYRSGTVFAPAGTVTAGIRNRFTAGMVVCEDMYDHVSGEFRYLYHDGDPFVSAGNVKATVQGQSHAFHYDVLLHPTQRESKIRPYFAVGVGAKVYVVNGPSSPAQPLGNIAQLSEVNQTCPLFTIGGGVKFRVNRHLLLRADFRDYMTPFPDHVIVPARLGTARGIFQQFTPLAGASFTF